MKVCSKCGQAIKTINYFESNYSLMCLDCADEHLTEEPSLCHSKHDNPFILNDEVKNVYLDDEIADIEMFYKETLEIEEIEEVIRSLKDEVKSKDAYIQGLTTKVA